MGLGTQKHFVDHGVTGGIETTQSSVVRCRKACYGEGRVGQGTGRGGWREGDAVSRREEDVAWWEVEVQWGENAVLSREVMLEEQSSGDLWGDISSGEGIIMCFHVFA